MTSFKVLYHHYSHADKIEEAWEQG